MCAAQHVARLLLHCVDRKKQLLALDCHSFGPECGLVAFFLLDAAWLNVSVVRAVTSTQIQHCKQTKRFLPDTLRSNDNKFFLKLEADLT